MSRVKAFAISLHGGGSPRPAPMASGADLFDLSRGRYRLLLRQLAAEGQRPGEIAKSAGHDQGQVSKFLRGMREPGLRPICDAMQTLDIDPRFFFDPKLGAEPRFRDHVGPRGHTAHDIETITLKVAERLEDGYRRSEGSRIVPSRTSRRKRQP